MNMLGAVPLYYTTEDKRILDYLQRNITTHELATGKTTVSASKIMHAEKYGPKLDQVIVMCALMFWVAGFAWVFFS